MFMTRCVWITSKYKYPTDSHRQDFTQKPPGGGRLRNVGVMVRIYTGHADESDGSDSLTSRSPALSRPLTQGLSRKLRVSDSIIFVHIAFHS
jgi:hypothetical protein